MDSVCTQMVVPLTLWIIVGVEEWRYALIIIGLMIVNEDLLAIMMMDDGQAQSGHNRQKNALNS